MSTRLMPLLIVAAGGGLLALVQFTDLSFSHRPANDIRAVLFLTVLAYYVWVRRWSRYPGRAQAGAIAAFAGLLALLWSVFRIDGFTGDGRPIWRWRGSPSSVAPWKTSLPDPASADRARSAVADLATETWSDYPAFRGPDRSAIRDDVRWTFDEGWSPQLLWARPMGLGWSSFAVRGDYAVTQEQRDDREMVVCYHIRTGEEIWCHADQTRFEEITGGAGPRATPSIDGQRVYALGATGLLNCLDGATGGVRWHVNVLDDNHVDNRLFGMAGSPLVVDGKVIVCPGGRNTSLVAYDQDTGTKCWTGGTADASYSSPQLAKFSRGTQILSFHAEGLSGHALDSGRELWRIAWISNPAERNNVCQPVPLAADDQHPHDRVFLSSGYGRGSALFELSVRNGEMVPHALWESRWLQSKFASVIVASGHIYGLDNQILTCLDLETGKRCWKAGRYGYGQLLLAGGVLVVQAESGEIALVEATPLRFREIYRFRALDDRTWNHPVVAGDLLLVRNDRAAACFRLPITRATPSDAAAPR